ncbi:MAG: hypothetical protein Q7U77_02530 [Sediminibacterium sp.]|uniref:hypothetical protein n=1 Tax=Sediminibacterium sp. TaxID=1917865 RepID=UPI002725D202|nr:hypothetical protein [Sediminibacterium sp.]MDO8995480.1 hypothetical protein [Sediminibacterium sp.]
MDISKYIFYLVFLVNIFLIKNGFGQREFFGQRELRYNEEKQKVLLYFQDSILTNTRYFPTNNQFDTVPIRNYLSNFQLFVQLKSNLLNPDFVLRDLHPPNTIFFNKSELNYIYKKTQLDTTREEIGFNFSGKINLVNNNSKSVNISKPVFLRNYKLCFLSFKNINRPREIFGPVYNLLLVNRNGKWGIANNSIDLMANYIDDDDW